MRKGGHNDEVWHSTRRWRADSDPDGDFGLILPERIGPKLDELKRLMEQAGRDFSTLELTVLADPPRLNEKEIRTYQAAGVNVLYMLPISNDHQAVIREMRKFATTMQVVG